MGQKRHLPARKPSSTPRPPADRKTSSTSPVAKKAGYVPQMVNSKGKATFILVTWLALLNANDPVQMERVYHFVEEYFPKHVPSDDNESLEKPKKQESWKSSLRGMASSKINGDLFVKLPPSKDREPQGKKGSYYTIKEGSRDFIYERLEKEGADPRKIGLKHPEDWEEIRAGTKGLPCVKPQGEGAEKRGGMLRPAPKVPETQKTASGTGSKQNTFHHHERPQKVLVRPLLQREEPCSSSAAHHSTVPDLLNNLPSLEPQDGPSERPQEEPGKKKIVPRGLPLVATWLAVLNAQGPVPLEPLYGFIKDHFRSYAVDDGRDWQKPVREKLTSNYLDEKTKKLFGKEKTERGRDQHYWLRPGSRGILLEKLRDKPVDVEGLGVEKEDVLWQILAGTKGLAEEYHTDQRLIRFQRDYPNAEPGEVIYPKMTPEDFRPLKAKVIHMRNGNYQLLQPAHVPMWIPNPSPRVPVRPMNVHQPRTSKSGHRQ